MSTFNFSENCFERADLFEASRLVPTRFAKEFVVFATKSKIAKHRQQMKSTSQFRILIHVAIVIKLNVKSVSDQEILSRKI